ncbi:MAG: bacillithiol biosynthesis deacetylase BshB1 [Chitinophagaceae bacterium]|nr:bacillithiol biosynthesis deacetylase BshB1 [Chitinophagaceae bacterium]
MKLDILAFGAHPDDIELSCTGTLLKEKMNGKKIGLIDLTEGELGTRGTPELRRQEAADANSILGFEVRENLLMSDGFFKNDEANQRKIIAAIRKYQPEIIFCNAPEDRHPDHGRSAQLVNDAAFLSGLKKIVTDEDGNAQKEWRPKYVFHFIQDRYLKPDFVFNITDVFDKKIEAIRAFKTQFFNPGSDEPETYISSPDFLDSVIYRSKMFGKMIGVKYAEGFITKKMIGIDNFDVLIQKDT